MYVIMFMSGSITSLKLLVKLEQFAIVELADNFR